MAMLTHFLGSLFLVSYNGESSSSGTLQEAEIGVEVLTGRPVAVLLNKAFAGLGRAVWGALLGPPQPLFVDVLKRKGSKKAADALWVMNWDDWSSTTEYLTRMLKRLNRRNPHAKYYGTNLFEIIPCPAQERQPLKHFAQGLRFPGQMMERIIRRGDEPILLVAYRPKLIHLQTLIARRSLAPIYQDVQELRTSVWGFVLLIIVRWAPIIVKSAPAAFTLLARAITVLSGRSL